MLLRSIAGIAGTLTIAGLFVSPAAAEPLPAAAPVRPQMSITIRYPTAATHEVCWSGRLRATTPTTAPTWTVTIEGIRLAGAPILDVPPPHQGATTLGCATIFKDGAAAGVYTVTFSYTGVGDDIPSTLVGLGLWTGAQNNKVEASQ